YLQLLPIGASSFIIHTEPNAYAAISMNGKLYGAAMAGTDGVAVVNLNPITVAGDANVVITMQNKEPYIGTVRVDSPTGAYLLLNTYTVNDATGNNNGYADYGEQPTLNVTLKNFGQLASGKLGLKLTSQDPFVSIKQDTANGRPVNPADSILIKDAFQISIDSLAPDRHVANLSLEVTDGTNSWTSKFTLPVRSRTLEMGTEVIYDPAPGNGNGLADPGETFTLKVPVTNTGQSTAMATSLSISTGSQYLTLNNPSVSLGELLPGAQKIAAFGISAAANTPLGTMPKITMLAKTSGNYSVSKDYLLTVGIISEDFEANNFNHLPWEQSGSLPWTITNANPEQGIYCARSGAITNAQSSTLSVTLNILRDGKITFYRKVSSEAGYDRLLFYIDDQLVGDWSGQHDWEMESFDVTAGTHIFRWTYLKDGSTSVGSDCAWIDNIIFPPVDTSPLIQTGALVINDDTGNKNGQLDPGETVSITLPVENNGLTPAVDAAASLTCSSPDVMMNQSDVSLGTMVRGSTYQPRFTATVSNAALIGEAVNLEFRLDAHTTSVQKSFLRTIGNATAIEDFERSSFNSMNWLSGGNNPWTIENTSSSLTGKFSARSGAIKDLQTSDLLITLEVVADDSIRFWLKTSSEKQADYLKFFIDGQQKGSWSGETAWTRVAFVITPGIHTFKWSYQKDYVTSAGSDAVWIDNIQFPPISPSLPLGTLASVNPVRICQGESAVLSVKASGGTGVYSYSWKPSDGLSDPLSANPVASPDASTDYNVEVNDGSVTSSTSIHLDVLQRPAIPVITVSNDGTTLYSSAYQGNQWYKDMVAIAGAVASSYIPVAAGSYSVKVVDYFNCSSERSLAFQYPVSGHPAT
ncbi:MAG: C25 family peptidase C-terminal domain-containing protein, partial [Bacteroidota bacterium]|nr:C25 family peptidase C-terminal domain-containing protein [Bacteroidota bacterium]